MTKEQAEKILQDVLDQLQLKKKDREALEHALGVLCGKSPEIIQGQ